MKKTLVDRFEKSRGQPITYKGKEIVLTVRFELESEGNLLIRRIKHKKDRVQGLRMKIKNGELIINNIHGKNLVLWSDTCPDKEVINYKIKKKAVLDIWNAWKYDDETMYWIMNAGMIVKKRSHTITLSCSDGTNDPDFNDLVVELEFEKGSKYKMIKNLHEKKG